MVTASAGSGRLYVTKILSGSENFTAETMQKMAGIFGYQVVIGLRRMPKHLTNIYKAGELERDGTCSIL